MESRNLLLYLSVIYKGDWNKMYNHIRLKEHLSISGDEIDKMGKNYKEKFITLLEEEYPTKLKAECQQPPLLLFYRGDISLLKQNKKYLTVIGSRKSSYYGRESTKKLVESLPDDIIIVSGLAKGIDTIGILAALDTNKKVIAVLGNGINFCYPKENVSIYEKIIEKGGLIISEFPIDTPPEQENFRSRNRILASLADAILVGEAKYNSGTRLTINYALNYGKNIGCVPYRSNESSLCNLLIKQGAELIETPRDVYELLNLKI